MKLFCCDVSYYSSIFAWWRHFIKVLNFVLIDIFSIHWPWYVQKSCNHLWYFAKYSGRYRTWSPFFLAHPVDDIHYHAPLNILIYFLHCTYSSFRSHDPFVSLKPATWFAIQFGVMATSDASCREHAQYSVTLSLQRVIGIPGGCSPFTVTSITVFISWLCSSSANSMEWRQHSDVTNGWRRRLLLCYLLIVHPQEWTDARANVIKGARQLFTGHIHLALTRHLHVPSAPDGTAGSGANTSRSSDAASAN